MKIFFDTEFYDRGGSLDVTHDLISIGLVSETGAELYIENRACDHSIVSPAFSFGGRVMSEEDMTWMRTNVLSKLDTNPTKGLWSSQIAPAITAFVGDEKPEFWAYFGAYDWVLLCKLFGGLLKLPKGWPHLFRDLRWLMDQYSVHKGLPGCPQQDPATQHHALHDAKWERDVYLWIQSHATSDK